MLLFSRHWTFAALLSSFTLSQHFIFMLHWQCVRVCVTHSWQAGGLRSNF
jgi:hypothetical protein